MFDIINLYISSKRLKGFIFNNKKYKCFRPNELCLRSKNVEFRFRSKFFIIFKVKKILENDLEIYLYMKLRLYLFLYSNLSLFSVFSHFCFCKRSCDHISSKEFYCEFCSRIYLRILDRQVCF